MVSDGYSPPKPKQPTTTRKAGDAQEEAEKEEEGRFEREYEGVLELDTVKIYGVYRSTLVQMNGLKHKDFTYDDKHHVLIVRNMQWPLTKPLQLRWNYNADTQTPLQKTSIIICGLLLALSGLGVISLILWKISNRLAGESQSGGSGGGSGGHRLLEETLESTNEFDSFPLPSDDRRRSLDSRREGEEGALRQKVVGGLGDSGGDLGMSQGEDEDEEGMEMESVVISSAPPRSKKLFVDDSDGEEEEEGSFVR